MKRSGRLRWSWTSSADVVLGCATIAAAGAGVSAQRGQGRGPAPTARAAAPVDLTGYWVSVVTEDWRFRMVTPPKGDYASVPLNAEARRVADAWDPSKDGLCDAYGAAAIMRMPGRLHITWQDDDTLKIETDAGQQTRLLHFGASRPAGSERTLQGYSAAEWGRAGGPPGLGGFGGFGGNVAPPDAAAGPRGRCRRGRRRPAPAGAASSRGRTGSRTSTGARAAARTRAGAATLGAVESGHHADASGLAAEERRAVQRERRDDRELHPLRRRQRRVVHRGDHRRGPDVSDAVVHHQHELQARSRRREVQTGGVQGELTAQCCVCRPLVFVTPLDEQHEDSMQKSFFFVSFASFAVQRWSFWFRA